MSLGSGNPISKIFLSCDLTGSTDFKQRNTIDDIPWQKVFLQFYREFPQRVATTQHDLKSDDLVFKLWKPVGDELIYSCDVRSEDEVYRAVRTWITAIRAYKSESLDDTPMGTKGGAFIATFPGPDSESSVPREPGLEVSDADVIQLNRDALTTRDLDAYVYDYFGPSIDTGFRVLSKCDSRYFTVSVEVALALIRRSRQPGTDQSNFHVDDLVLLDFVELKGVWAGKRYPIVALDLEYEDPVNQAYSKFERRTGADEIEELCLACYQAGNWPCQMYLPNSQDDRFRVEPIDPFLNLATTSSEGVEEPATDEPEGAADLTEDPPLGAVKYRTGFTQIKLDSSLPQSQIDAELRALAEAEANLAADEYIARWRPQPPVPAAEPDKLIYSAYWGTIQSAGPKVPDRKSEDL